jgi:hypothetical protein
MSELLERSHRETNIMTENPDFVTDIDGIQFKLIGKATNQRSNPPSIEDTIIPYNFYVVILSYVDTELQSTIPEPVPAPEPTTTLKETLAAIAAANKTTKAPVVPEEDEEEIYLDRFYDGGDPTKSKKDAPYSIFWAYQSNSELGMWRLAGSFSSTEQHLMNKLADDKIRPDDFPLHTYFVGDYVQSTLINIELQKFINSNLSAIPRLRKTDVVNLTRYINDTLRSTKLTADNCTNPFEPASRNIPASPSLVSSYSSGRPSLFFPQLDGQLPELNPALRAIHGNNVTFPFPFIYMALDHASSSSPESKPDNPFASFMLPISMRKFKSFQCGELGNREGLIKFSRYLEGIYDVQYPITKVDDHVNRFEDIIDVDGEIYKVSLTRKSEIDPAFLTYELDDKYKPEPIQITVNPERDILPVVEMYFLKAHMRCLNKSSIHLPKVLMVCRPATHYMPIFLTVPGASINRFGVYDKYINAGSFICKMFDYHYQCFPEETERRQCTSSYTYIGHRYRNMFPFRSIVAEMEGTAPPGKERTSTGGRRRRSHSRNRKTAKKRRMRRTRKNYRKSGRRHTRKG